MRLRETQLQPERLLGFPAQERPEPRHEAVSVRADERPERAARRPELTATNIFAHLQTSFYSCIGIYCARGGRRRTHLSGSNSAGACVLGFLSLPSVLHFHNSFSLAHQVLIFVVDLHPPLDAIMVSASRVRILVGHQNPYRQCQEI